MLLSLQKRFHKFFLTLFSYIFVSSTRRTEKKCMKNFSNQSTLFYFFGIWKLYQATASVRFKQYILCVESVDNNFGFYGFSAGGARHVNKMIRGAELIEFSFWLWGSQKSQSSQLCLLTSWIIDLHLGTAWWLVMRKIFINVYFSSRKSKKEFT